MIPNVLVYKRPPCIQMVIVYRPSIKFCSQPFSPFYFNNFNMKKLNTFRSAVKLLNFYICNYCFMLYVIMCIIVSLMYVFK